MEDSRSREGHHCVSASDLTCWESRSSFQIYRVFSFGIFLSNLCLVLSFPFFILIHSHFSFARSPLLSVLPFFSVHPPPSLAPPVALFSPSPFYSSSPSPSRKKIPPSIFSQCLVVKSWIVQSERGHSAPCGHAGSQEAFFSLLSLPHQRHLVFQVYVLKRPYVDEFLRRMGELFECVLFTASLSKYADPVADLLDKWGAFRARLFRESCVFHQGNYVKDLSRLGRDLNNLVIVDNSPASYVFHPNNAVPIASWFDDMSDTELLDLIPFFERLSKEEDIFTLLQEHQSR
ncbi:uncharacterized protein LOC122551954 [Chiloscyllium plagiosum]|uniref:uncharacterized protein LOC122551954 n=1 Tax=Chiloscyllium plagiosum TaxID=36176 RepID=UPI001CB8550E|nr:uncharacterized protein LOC122551954 [Chiloscyllium plagiosum]